MESLLKACESTEKAWRKPVERFYPSYNGLSVLHLRMSNNNNDILQLSIVKFWHSTRLRYSYSYTQLRQHPVVLENKSHHNTHTCNLFVRVAHQISVSDICHTVLSPRGSKRCMISCKRPRWRLRRTFERLTSRNDALPLRQMVRHLKTGKNAIHAVATLFFKKKGLN